ncbi:zinc finger and BTB domain-containing protein 12-like [Heptranchias perlo]|uniref:zinc finger and BTB domain-containing protein 12-like n=1 Tax=Heptranchias perlo TaxID=212740 RepID=UPI003559C30D
MASDDVLRFHFPNHEVTILKRMNQLRLEERFCDVTVLVDRLRFPGHRVVLAACSPFLRDQFHMNPSQEVQVFPMTGAQIVLRLLLSCYTGVLEFPFNDILDYLTAASCLQMEHVVEKCRQSLSPRIGPRVTSGEGGETGEEQRPGTPQIASSSERGAEGEKGLGVRAPQEDVVKVESEQRADFAETARAEDICIRKVESLADCMGGRSRGGGCGKPRGGVAGAETTNGLEPDPRIHSTVGGAAESTAPGGGYSDNGAPYDMSEVMISDDFQEEDYESSASEECRSSGFSGSFYRPADELPLNAPHPHPAGQLVGQGGKEGEAGGPALCSECGAPFEHREHLASHMVVHKLYMCLLCGKVFKKNARLAQHINVHTGFKPYCCAICGRTFTQKRSLKDHMNVHNGDSPHCCNYCDMRFTHYSTLRVHLRDQHGKTTTRNLENKPAEISLVVP